MGAATSPHAVDATMSLALCLVDGVEETVHTTSTPSMRHHVRHLARAGGRDGHTVTLRLTQAPRRPARRPGSKQSEQASYLKLSYFKLR